MPGNFVIYRALSYELEVKQFFLHKNTDKNDKKIDFYMITVLRKVINR